MERGKDWALWRAVPLTGRAHQIRLHLAHIGHPILGDKDYHPDSSCHGLVRHALHAHRLSLRHPATGVVVTWKAPFAADLEAAMLRLRGSI